MLGDRTSPLSASDDGVYLLNLELFHADATGVPTGTQKSPPFWLLFDKNASPADEAAALSYVQTMLVPEPGSIAAIGLCAVTLLRRRRGARA